ncbi:Adaptive-response sensory-kinase SasA [Pseudomonas fluorescens]|nr:Adaptive-response sensory-kinase SasA [Pseudomonas fluorescens]
MAAIFSIDSATSYEIAVSVFYAGVILTAAPILGRQYLMTLSGACIAMTLLSFGITAQGDYRAGLVNMTISIVSIVITAHLVLKMEAARAAAHDAQARLLRIARVKSLEGLTTSIAHEVNQPLAAIVTSGNACQRWLDQDPPNLDKARLALHRILSDATRASDIIARVRSLTKGEPPQRLAFDFNEAAREVIAMSRNEMARAGIALEVELGPQLPLALADRVQVQQVIGNLLLNAIEATAPAPAGRRIITLASACEQAMIVFSVCDSGTGLAEADRDRLFEAFWTTKAQGIGVGLSISRTIVEANGGHISARPNENAGALFWFSVPTLDKEPA